jgi:glycosyltransferase involved in cell wall biosynthesis
MTTIHFIYPHGSSISAPRSIGRILAERMRAHYDVHQYWWDEIRVIRPDPGDVLLGHPHPAPWTVFRRSARQQGWHRIIALWPFKTEPGEVAFADGVLSRCDLNLAISGDFWFESLEDSLLSHWAPKMRRIDMAVDRSDFPVIKTEFNPPGSRRFLYIGGRSWSKNTDYLEEIAARMPSGMLSWMGAGRKAIRGVNWLGYHDFSASEAQRLVAAHDFMITVGRADANPTTVLEAMAWGLVPVCTPTSGYVGYPGIVNVPVDDAARALDVLQRLQASPDGFLREMQAANWEALDATFSWERFAGQVLEAVRSDESPPMLGESLTRKAQLRARALTVPLSSPYCMLRRRNWGHFRRRVGESAASRD